MIYLLEVQMSPPEALWKENDSPFSLTIPQGGEGARHDTLPGGSTGHRPRPTNISLGINLQRSVTPIIFTVFYYRLCIFF